MLNTYREPPGYRYTGLISIPTRKDEVHYVSHASRFTSCCLDLDVAVFQEGLPSERLLGIGGNMS